MGACCTNGHHLGVGRWVVGARYLIAAFADNFVFVNNDRTEWAADVGGDSLLSEFDGSSHELLVKFRHGNHHFLALTIQTGTP